MKLFIPLLMLFAIEAKAQNIPVLYSNKCASTIQVPDENTHPAIKDLISGYETDANCTTIFVHPPKLGRIRNLQYMKNMLVDYMCPGAQREMKTWVSLLEKKSKTDSSLEHDRLGALEDKLLTNLKKYDRQEAVTLKVVVDMEWDKVVRAYKELNPSVTAVMPLPIHSTVIGAESINVFESQTDYVLGSVLFSDFIGLRSMREDQNRVLDLDNTPDLTLTGSLSGKLILSMNGGCPFYNLKTKKFDFKLKEDSLESPMATFAVNMAYYYRTKAQGIYGLEFNSKNLFDQIVKNHNAEGSDDIELTPASLLKSVEVNAKVESDNGTNPSLPLDVYKSLVNHIITSSAASVNGDGDSAKVVIKKVILEKVISKLNDYYTSQSAQQIVVRGGTLSFHQYE